MTEADVERRDAVRRPAPGPDAPVARRRAGPGPAGLGRTGLGPAGLGLAALLLVFVALGIGPAPAAGAQTPPATSPTPTSATSPTTTGPATTPGPASADQAPAGQGGPQVVKVGLFVENISNLDLQEGSFQADFYLWFVWKGDIDPTKTYELTNALPLQLAAVAGSTTKDGTPVPDVQPDGNHQVFHVKGRFTSEFKTGNYPLDDANLVISVEDVKYDSSVLVYEFDNGSGMSANTKVTAREVRAPTARVTEHFYATTFGYEGEPGDVAFSRLDITMKAERPGVALVLQSIFPLVVVVFAAMASLLIESPAGEEGGDAHWWWLATRLSLAVPAVIAAVALQFTASTGVPREGQVLLIDRIYLLSYAVILAVIAITVVTHRALRKGRPQRTKKVDRWSLFSLVPMFLGGIALILLLR